MVCVILTYWHVFLILGNKDLYNLASTLHDNVMASLVPSTWKGYESVWRQYADFCSHANFPVLPPNPVILALFFTHLQSSGLKYGTITKAVSALSLWFRDSGYQFPSNNFLLDSTLGGIRKLAPPTVKKDAVRIVHLIAVHDVLVGSSPADCRNWLILLVSFFGLLRISEVVRLVWSDIKWEQDGVWLKLSPSKKQNSVEFVPLVANQDSRICPVMALRQWRFLCGPSDGGDQGIFRYANRLKVTSNKCISVGQARSVCKDLLLRAHLPASRLITHGARRGGYQLCESLSVNEADAQHLGRWMQASTTREYSGGHLAARLRAATRLAGR